MICFFCSRPITKYQMADRVEVWRQYSKITGEKFGVFGNTPGADGTLREATGWFQRAYHSKCWLAEKRRKALQAAKDADPSAHQGDGADWREPVTAEVEDFRPRESDRDYRGTGTPGC